MFFIFFLEKVIPINVGCLGECTYCKTKHARGHLGSYPREEIKERVEKVIEEGVREIRITSEDTGAYGIDLKTDISELLDDIVPLVPDGCVSFILFSIILFLLLIFIFYFLFFLFYFLFYSFYFVLISFYIFIHFILF